MSCVFSFKKKCSFNSLNESSRKFSPQGIVCLFQVMHGRPSLPGDDSAIHMYIDSNWHASTNMCAHAQMRTYPPSSLNMI